MAKRAVLFLILTIWMLISSVTFASDYGNPPEAVTVFLQAYANGVIKGDVDKIMSHYSEHYLQNRRDKSATTVFWRRLLTKSSFQTFHITLTRFEQKDDIANVSGTVTANKRVSKLMISQIIKESGQWKWYGNQIGDKRIDQSINVSFVDPRWNGEKIPEKEQCKRFGGEPKTPALKITQIPEGTEAVIMEYSDRDWPPMDNGGHGIIGFRIKNDISEVVIPSIPGHEYNLPAGFFIIAEHRGASWDKAGAYMPPCSGGRGNRYYVTIQMVRINASATSKKARYQEIARTILELGKY